MGIVAAFDKMLFYNEANKYCVLRLKTADQMIPENARDQYKFSDHLIRFVAVGYDLPRTSAIKMELEGTWIDSKYGCRYEVNTWQEVIPKTKEGILNYLSSGLLKGIGPKTAETIVERFGEKSLDVLEHAPEKLLEIRGITEERLEEIKQGYAESTVLRNLMILLSPFKISRKTAEKIYDFFGPDSAALLRKSFYQLCQIPGYGFKRVDDIVAQSGGNLHDPMRVQGALFYALEKSRSENGHLYMEAEKLTAGAMALLNERIPQLNQRLQRDEVMQELVNAVKNNVLVSSKGNLYLPRVFAQESETACKVVKMVLEAPEPVILAPVMEQVMGKLSIELSPMQYKGVEMVFQHNLSIITGGPGTGKSTILKSVIEAYRIIYPEDKIALGAPTGKASRRMAETTGIASAATLHSLLELHDEDAGWQKTRELDADFLIVDECSMMDMWLAHQLFTRLKPKTKVLLVGDADQLESVGAGSAFRELIQCGLVPVTVLDQIFRQSKGSRIAYNAKFVKEGRTDLYYGRDFQFIEAEDQTHAAQLIRDLYRTAIQYVRMDQVQILSPFRSRGDASTNSINDAIQSEVHPPAPSQPEMQYGGRLFRLGDRVMQTKNDYDIRLTDKDGGLISVGAFNGEVGTVCGIGTDGITVDFDGRYAEYPQEDLDELELAYAITIHKSQGSEYDMVIIPMLPAHKILLSRNLFYTAITRAKKRVVLIGIKQALYMAIKKNDAIKRNTLLGERINLYHRALTRQNNSANGAKLKNTS